MIKLSLGQQNAFDQIMRWYKSGEQTFVLAGYAGTGKSTLANKIAAPQNHKKHAKRTHLL